jgi:arginase
MRAPVDVIGVPSSAGAHGPGQEKAPAALRAAGLISSMAVRDIEVRDLGDLPLVRFQPDPDHPKRQNVQRVRHVADRVADAVDPVVRAGRVPLVLGGDCTITLGVVSGLLRSSEDLGLLYFDGDADLSTPVSTHSGIFDGMGIAHLIGLEGAEPELARMGPRCPLMPEQDVLLFGFHPHELEAGQQEQLERTKLITFPVTGLRRPITEAARAALRLLEARTGRIVVHFDVDVMSSSEIPLGDWPHYDGLSLSEAMEALLVFADSPKLAAMVVTEINPDHDPEGLLLRRFADDLARSLRPLAPQPARPEEGKAEKQRQAANQ